MAVPCIEYKGKKYSYAEFATLLHDGELANLVNDGVLKGFEDIPSELKIVRDEAVPARNTPANENVQPRVEPLGKVRNVEQQNAPKENVQPANDVRASEVTNEVTLDDIQNFINETYLNDEKGSPTAKADQGAIEDSNEKNRAIPIVEKGKKQVKVTKEGKVSMQGRKSLAKRQFKGDRKTASEIDPTDATSLALQYFVNGGKVASDYFAKKSERQARTNGLNGIASKEAKTAKGRKATIDEIAHDIWESAENEKLNIDSRDIKNAVEDVVNGNLTVQNVVDSLLKSYNVEKEDLADYERKYAEAFQEYQEEEQDYSEESIKNIESSLDYLSDAEIVELANSQEKSFDDYIKDLESRQVTYDLGPFISEQGTIQPDGYILSEDGELLSPESVRNVKQVNPGVKAVEKLKTPVSKKSPELIEVNKQLKEAQEKEKTAKDALLRKMAKLDNEAIKDNQDLFGKRKSEDANLLFDERVDSNARNKVLEKEKARLNEIREEIKALKETKAKIESGETVSTSEMDFESQKKVNTGNVEINKQIENGNITPKQVDEFVNDDRKAAEIEPIVKAVESKAKSDSKVELKQVVVDVENEIKREPADRRDDGRVQKYSGKSLVQQENKRPGIVVQAESKMPPTKNFVSRNYEIDEVQKQGVNSALSLFENGGKSFLLADGTGVGKTRQILVTAKEYLDKFGGKVLIISENTTILTKNFANDAKALGINMNEFEFGTYNDLRTGKKGKDNYGLVIYDEAHNLKNQESGKAIAAGNIKSKNNMYVTATPMDTIGSAVYFISEVSGVTEEEAYSMLGLNVKKEKDTLTGQEVKIVTLQEGVAPADIKRNIVKIREEIISKGAMLRREYPFYGEFVEDKISLTEEQAEEQDEIESNWDDRIEAESVNDDGRVNFRKKMNLSGQKSGELSRWSESTKIKYTFKEVVKAIKEGKKVVVIAEGVNETTITAIDKVVPGFLSELSKMLKAEGYKVAEIFGKSDKGEANDKFQSNEVDVVLGTAKSASTGIDLDDQNGNAPRVLFMVTPNYSGNVFQQILGRVSRRNTKSPAQIRLLFNESNIDARRKQIVNGKLQTLKAIQEGVIDDEIEIDIQEAPAPSAEVTVNLEGITLEDISEKAFAVKGDNTKFIKDDIKALGGRYNPKYGWIFPKSRKAEVQEMLNKLSDKNQPSEEAKKLSDKVRNLKIDLGKMGEGGLQSNPLGLPVGIWNVSMDIIATSIDAGMEIGEAIKKAIAYIEKNNKGVFDKIKFANVINNSLANNNIILNETTSLDLKQKKIRGRFLNEAQANKLQKEIESKYVTDKPIELFSKEKDDIRMALFNYENPIAEKNSNGVNLRIATGLIRTNEEGVREKTYLLYADGKIVGEFYSVDDVKKVIKLIEDNLVKEIPEFNSQQIKDNVNAEVDRIAQKVKDLLPGIKDPDLKLQGLSQDDLIDLVANAVKALISKGIDINDAIQQVVASIKERFNVDVDQDLVKAKLNITNIPQDFEREQGRKSVAGRMASGNSAIIKRAIANNSLDYEIENQKEAKEKADAFVDEVGFNNALIAVRDGLVDGGQGAFIYARAIEILEQEINTLKGEDKLDAVADYMKLLDEIAVELDLRSRKYGQFISALANIYYSSKGRYNLTKMVKDYKAENKGVISKEVLEKLKNVEEKLKESEAKLAELETKKRIEEENEAFNNILESVARRKAINTNAKITDKQKLKAFADKLRSFKISNLGGTNVATPYSVVYDLAIEAAAQALELTGAVSDAIKAGVESIRKANLSKDEQQQALSDLFDLFDDSDVTENTSQKGMMSVNDEGMLRIPHSLIREKVENGIDNIEDLVSELMADVKELFPDSDFTERQVRDAVTGYGKISNPTSDEIENQISIIKSIGKIASGIEDANKGQRPLRSGQQRREPTMKERTEMKKLKALLRDLPLADADITKAYKTALDAIKKRLSNEIEELDEQIAKGEKRKGEKSVIEYDQEAKDLKAIRDSKKAELDELVGKPELTDQQKIDRAEKLLQKRLDDLQQKIDSNEIDYAKKPEPVTSANLEDMRKLKKELDAQIQKMREDAGMAEARLIESAKRNASKRLATLKERIANKDFSPKKRKPTPTDVELNKIRAEIAEQKEIFDKEVYKLELKNRRIEQKAFDVLKDILSVPKILSFTVDLSFVGIQNVTQIYKMSANSLINLAKTGRLKGTFREAMAKTFKAMASPSFEQKYMQAVKANPNYQLWKDSKLGIVESHYKESAKAEVFQNNLVTTLFDILGNYVASKGFDKTGDIIKNYINVISIFERGQTVFENQMRINRFQEGADLLKAQGFNPIDDIKEYKKVAAAVNTLTGRANTGSKFAAAAREANGTLFSSFSNWAAGVNQLNPYWYYTLTPTARKMALTDVAHHIVGAGSLLSMAAIYALGQDDDDENKVTVETDPTSSDFALIKVGNLRIDPWAGKKTTVVAFARLRYAEKKDKYGNFKKYGFEYEDEDWIDLPLEYVGNKIAPGPRFAIDRFFKTKKVEYQGKSFREDKYGVDFKESKYLVPLIFENFREVNEEQPSLFGKATMALSWTGIINTNVYGGMKEGFKDMPDDLIEKEYKVKIQKIKDDEKKLEFNVDKMTKEYVEKKINKFQIMQKVDSLAEGDPELFNKTMKSIIQKVNKEELKTLVTDPFYLGLKKEKNPKIQAILFYSKFKDDKGMSDKDKKERDKNLRYVEFDLSPEFIRAYQELKNTKKKPIN
jgi:hypothetical protein